MAMPKKFTEYLGVRLSKRTRRNLKKRAEIMGLAEAVVARIIIEHSVDGIKYEQPE